MKQYIWDPLSMNSTTFRPSLRPDIKSRLPDMLARSPSGDLEVCPIPTWPLDAKDDIGGAGLFSTAGDFMQVLKSLLRDDQKLVKSETLEEMFRPQLPDAKYLKESVMIPQNYATFAPLLPSNLAVNFGLGGLIYTEDAEESGKRKGNMQWGGHPNLIWVSLKFP
jgi:CubicO group peptidase (beta-lactamase class C family)